MERPEERPDPGGGQDLPPELAALLRAGPPGGMPEEVGPPRPDGPEAQALAAEQDEIRRMVRAGAGTPEELRALAERLRAHRQREDQLWRTAVKPTLKRSGFDSGPARRYLGIGAAVLGCVLVVIIAAALGNVAVVLVPLLAVLVAAYVLGTRSSAEDAEGPEG